MKKNIAKIALLALLIAPFGIAHLTKAATPNWNTTGSYVVDFNYQSVNYSHDMSLTQDNMGNLTGHGGSPAGSNVYTWALTSGSVSGNTIDFMANYTATADAVTPQTTMHVTGTIAPNGTMSGTWSDNYQGGSRAGTWDTTSGMATAITALPGTLAAQDFGVVNYDTGLGMLKGYTAGFGVTDATFAGAQSVVVKLYSGTTLLQTNTAILPKFNADITGIQFSSPFDVSGNFAYATDGYWTNVKESQYGQSMPATKVVATVTLANGKIVTAENTNLTGDPTTIYPANIASVMTNPATAVTMTDATLNGTNGNSAATGHSFWVSLNTFSTASPTIPSGVYSTPDFGAIAANTPFSASLSSLTTTGIPTNLPTIMPNTTYYFAAWSLVGGTWYPGQILTFTTSNSTVGGGDNGGDKNENEAIENNQNENEGMENGNDHGGTVVSGGEDNHTGNIQGSNDQGNTSQDSSSSSSSNDHKTSTQQVSTTTDNHNQNQSSNDHRNNGQRKDN